MGYSKSKKAVRRVQNYLEQMVAAEGNIEFPSAEPTKLIYYIRDGIQAARNFPEVHAYASLVSKYVIKAGPGKVICELRDVLALTRISLKSEISIPDVVEPLGMIGAAIKHKNADVIIFPDASTDTILTRKQFLQNWADTNGYKLIDSIDHVTLEKQNGANSTQRSAS